MEITASGRSLEEEELRELISLLREVNLLARSFAKSGIDLRRWLREEWSTRQALPAFRVLADGKEQFFCSEDEYREFLAMETHRLGREPRIGEEESLASESENGERDDLFVYEIHGAEELARAGVHPRIIQKRAGHSSLATTQRYIEVTPDQERRAVRAIRF